MFSSVVVLSYQLLQAFLRLKFYAILWNDVLSLTGSLNYVEFSFLL